MEKEKILKEEKRMVLLAGMLGFLEDDNNFNGLGATKNARNIISSNISKILTKAIETDENSEKTYQKVKKGKLKVVVISPEEMESNKRKCLETEVKVNREALITLQENALITCESCSRLRSKCALRKALLRTNAPHANDGKGKCQFSWKEE